MTKFFLISLLIPLYTLQCMEDKESKKQDSPTPVLNKIGNAIQVINDTTDFLTGRTLIKKAAEVTVDYIMGDNTTKKTEEIKSDQLKKKDAEIKQSISAQFSTIENITKDAIEHKDRLISKFTYDVLKEKTSDRGFEWPSTAEKRMKAKREKVKKAYQEKDALVKSIQRPFNRVIPSLQLQALNARNENELNDVKNELNKFSSNIELIKTEVNSFDKEAKRQQTNPINPITRGIWAVMGRHNVTKEEVDDANLSIETFKKKADEISKLIESKQKQIDDLKSPIKTVRHKKQKSIDDKKNDSLGKFVNNDRIPVSAAFIDIKDSTMINDAVTVSQNIIEDAIQIATEKQKLIIKITNHVVDQVKIKYELNFDEQDMEFLVEYGVQFGQLKLDKCIYCLKAVEVFTKKMILSADLEDVLIRKCNDFIDQNQEEDLNQFRIDFEQYLRSNEIKSILK